MIIRPLRMENRNIPVRTQAAELIIYPKKYKRLGLKFGDTIKIPTSKTFPRKWWGEEGIIVERYKSVNRKPSGAIFYNRGAEVLFISNDPKKRGKVRRFCNKLCMSDRVMEAVI